MVKNSLKNLIINVGKFFIKLEGEPGSNIINNYEKEKSLIKNLYNQPLYWHGTGRYHHNTTQKTVDVLQGIIQDNGLKPLVKDPWLKVEGDYKYTISLANIRMYASVYAMIHQEEGSKTFLYGKRFIWSMLVGLINMIQEPLDIICHALLFTFKGGKNKIKGFQTKVRKKNKLQDLKLFVLQLMYMPSIRSDIKKNYPILIAIKSREVKESGMDSGFDYYETRTEDPITFNKISHIEVPLEYLDETQNIFKKNNIDIKVISIESAELFIKNNSTVEEQLIPTPEKTFTDNFNKKVKIPYSLIELQKYERKFSENDSFHRFAHALRSYIYSCMIASKFQDVDLQIVSLAAFFHDIGRSNSLILNHGKFSAEWISKNLDIADFRISHKQKERIAKLCGRHGTKDTEDISTELKIVKDADSLDRWRLPIGKTKSKFLRTKIAKEMNFVVKDLLQKYRSINPKNSEAEKAELCFKYFGIELKKIS